MEKLRKSVAIFMAILLFLNVLPISSLADVMPKEEDPKSIIPIKEEEKIDNPNLTEVIAKREKYTKHYLKKDKSFEAVVYPVPIHYQEGAEWKDIDNRLEEVEDENKEKVLANKQNNYKVKLAKHSTSKKLVHIKKDEYEVSWGIEGAKKTPAIVREKDKKNYDNLPQEEKKKVLFNLSSVVDYKDLFPNTDLSYEIISDKIKESIIVKDKVAQASYTFQMNVKNIVPRLEKDLSISFYDKKDPTKLVFTMDSPFMFDASGATSNDIKLDLQVDGDKATMILEPNLDWLNSKERIYPITIDPSLGTSLDSSKIRDSHVSEMYPTTNYEVSVMNKTGYGPSSARNRTYLSFALPTLTTAETVVAAQLALGLYSQNNTNSQVNIHEVTEAWDDGTITWNNQPTFNAAIEDYQKISGEPGTFETWNITKLVKKWYQSGINNGLMLKAKDEYTGYTEYVSSNTNATYQGYRPQVVLLYVNNSGLESYWTYHSQDLGRSGTGHVNDFNGNLIYVHSDTSMGGNRMPVSINHVFNSNERGMNSGYGLGWRLNLSQKVEYKLLDGEPYYLYTDEDGTIHYLKFDSASNSYKDESGLDLALKIQSSSTSERYVLEDKKDNKLIFTSTGFLYKIQDSNLNTMVLSYSGSSLQTVTDGSGRRTALTYVNGLLSTIKEPGGRVTTYIYSGNHLKTIQYADGKTTNFEYDRITKLLSITGIDGYKIKYGYNVADPYQVNSIQETHTSGSIGQSMTLKYGDNVTYFTDNKGRKTQYQFNDSGHTISIQNHKGFAQYYKYFEDNETSGGNKNKLVEESKLQQTVMNYLRNHNLESTRFWVGSNDVTSTGSRNFSTSEKYIGDQAIQIQKTNSMGINRFSQEVTLEKGKTYTLSAYIKAQGISKSNGKGAALVVSYQDSSGTWKDVVSPYTNGSSETWERQQVTVTVPSNAISSTISAKLVLAEETGTAYFDAVQLELGDVSTRYNLLENSDFRYLENNLPLSWNKNAETDSNDWVVTDTSNPAPLDDRVFKMKGDSSKNKNIWQTVNVNGKAGDVFVFNGWAKGNSIPLSYPRYFALDLIIYYSDGTKEYVPVQFNPDSEEWQYLSAMAKADKSYYQVSLYGLYYMNENQVFFDGFQLYQEPFSTSFDYDSKGNLVSSIDLASQQGKFEYNGNNDLISYLDPKGNQFKYDYDDKHNLEKATTAANVVYSFDYDSSGNPIWGMVGDSTLFMKSTATYTTSGNYTKTVTNSSGDTVTYNFDEAEDELDSVRDAKGQTTNYQYDIMSNLNTVSKTVKNQDGSTATVSNQYFYENDRLKSLTHHGGTYTFNYDSFGNQKEVYVGSQKIFTNNYESNNGNLSETGYSNNQTIGYAYDELDRLSSLRYNGIEKFRYGYNQSGTVGLLKDLENGIDYHYDYDFANRLSKVKDTEGNAVSYQYDKNNNITHVQEIINKQQAFETSYQYDKDNRPSIIAYTRGSIQNTLSFQYDKLGRLTEKTISSPTNFKTSYQYKAGINGSSTNQVESISNNGESISYTYDAKGNIETITTDKGEIHYYYNELDELIREDNQLENQTIVYEYDLGGNLLFRKYYAYTETSTLGTPVKMDTYQYGDANWKDKLTNFNGQSITYDAIGNPTTYNGYSYTWDRVDQLKSITGNGNDVSYKYNVDGIRTGKTVNGVTTNYHLDGDLVTFESNGTDHIYYTYDSNDQLISMNLNGEEFFYIRNVQSDIIGLFDKDGVQVVSYQYDTWGNHSVSGSLASTVGEKNPYRYRGYRFDKETELYYLQSRYYSPGWGRFLNADAVTGKVGTLLSHNFYSYTTNNPVNLVDPSGYAPVNEGQSVDESRKAYNEWERDKKLKNSIITGGMTGSAGSVIDESIKPQANKIKPWVSKPKQTFKIDANKYLSVGTNFSKSTVKSALRGSLMIGAGGFIAGIGYDVLVADADLVDSFCTNLVTLGLSTVLTIVLVSAVGMSGAPVIGTAIVVGGLVGGFHAYLDEKGWGVPDIRRRLNK